MSLNDDILHIFEDPAKLQAKLERDIEPLELVELDLADLRQKVAELDRTANHTLEVLTTLRSWVTDHFREHERSGP